MKISIHQPMYIPWIPYFVKLVHSDVMVFFDNVQYPRSKNYINRNYIKTISGPSLLTVSIKKRSSLSNINEIEIDNKINWQKKHWKSISINYKKSKYFKLFKNDFEELYLNKKWNLISELNIALIKLLCRLCNIKTKFYNSSELSVFNNSTDQYIINIIKFLKGKTYITGISEGSMRYIKKKNYIENGIILKKFTYDAANYKQINGEFVKDCSILDLFFNYGSKTKHFLFNNSSLKNF